MFKFIIDSFTGREKKQLKKELDYQKALTLLYVLKWAVTLGVYEKDSLGRGATYCNVWAYEVLDRRCRKVWNVKTVKGQHFAMGGEVEAYDYDITSIMRDYMVDNLLNTPIPVAYKLGLKAVAGGIIKELTPAEAQAQANKGIPVMVISEKLNHVAIVAPTFKEFDEKKGCFLANVGGYNDMMFMSDPRGFGSFNWKDPEIKYWEFPECRTDI